MAKVKTGKVPGLWSDLGRELLTRTTTPPAHPSFVMYFAVGVVIFAGFGVWAEVKRLIFTPCLFDLESFRVAISVFYPSLGCAAMLQLSWGADTKLLRSFAQTIACLFVAAFAAMPDGRQYDVPVSAIGVFLSGIAMWSWWIANAHAPEFQDKRPPTAIGPDPTSTLLGNLEEYRVD